MIQFLAVNSDQLNALTIAINKLRDDTSVHLNALNTLMTLGKPLTPEQINDLFLNKQKNENGDVKND